MQKITLLFILTCYLCACSTAQKSRLAATAIGFAAGSVIGAATAPSDERTDLHALYWAGLIGVAAAVAANYYFSDERQDEILRLENEKLKAQLDFFQQGPSTLLKETTGTADKNYFHGKAKIKLYQIDQWIDDGPNKKYHRDQMIEILPLDKNSL